MSAKQCDGNSTDDVEVVESLERFESESDFRFRTIEARSVAVPLHDPFHDPESGDLLLRIF